MDPLFLSAVPRPHPARRTLPRSLWFAATAATAFAVSNMLAATDTPRAANGVDPANSAPPEYADAAHVSKGCYISTVAYLARFLTQHPTESGQPLTVTLKSFDGPHTIAVITWRGAWWGRDEYSGVFALRCRVEQGQTPDDLREPAARSLSAIAQRQLKRGRISAGPDTPGGPSLADRRTAVTTAAKLLPCAAEVYWVTTPRERVPLLYFRPYQGRIAVYDPATGTATALCEPTNVTEVLKMVATQLRYNVVGIRSESAMPPLAPATSLRVGLATPLAAAERAWRSR